MNRKQTQPVAVVAALLIGCVVSHAAYAGAVTSATLPDDGGENTITDFVADSTDYTVTDYATATNSPAAERRYFRSSTDPGSHNAALGDNDVTTGVLNTAGTVFSLNHSAILAADVFFVTDVNASSGSADTFSFQAVDAGGNVLASSATVSLTMSAGGVNTLLVFSATLVNADNTSAGAITGLNLNASTFTLADFSLDASDLAAVAGVKLTNTGGVGDPGLVGLAQVVSIPTPAALPAGLMMLGLLVMRRK